MTTAAGLAVHAAPHISGRTEATRATEARRRGGTSFLIALEREAASAETGPARTFLPKLRGRPLVISIICVEELLEGAADEAATLTSLQRFTIQGLHLTQARRCALTQRRASRRLGENDAWLIATAESLDADVVGADRAAFERLGKRYLRFR